MRARYFVTGTGTNVGKTFVTRGFAAAARGAGHSVLALKPIETGCAPSPLDARALARAANREDAVSIPGFYRAREPVSPYAAQLGGDPTTPDVEAIVHRVRTLGSDVDLLLVEGAGGLLTPLTDSTTIADLAVQLAFPILLVAANELGTLSHTLAIVESAERRGLTVAAIILTDARSNADPSARFNREILATHTHKSIMQFLHVRDDDDALTRAATEAGLLALLA